ncbi:MAG: bifunctional alpha/beta hydrolase/OsmC family protein [Desulfopila sp.]|nr:bifunctional alpha/beta hydrolase/OsmC family protein [Desulfopila sp.]
MRFDFLNKNGESLSGTLDLPPDGAETFALFAHCFTCSKDGGTAEVISRELALLGIAVLRFDFTGLGSSQGDFSNTNFSSNVEDIVSACSQLEKEYRPVEMLIGHSLGGAAVLEAAAQLEKVAAVVTIGAPSDPAHIERVFQNDLDTVRKNGSAEVTLAGRTFTIKKQLLDDIGESNLLEKVRTFRKALLVMHAPLDTIVSIDHAAAIFLAAKHPKSFVTLDNADHLLSREKDGRYSAKVIAAWADRYISRVQQKKVPGEQGLVTVKSRAGARFTQDIMTVDHHAVADEPLSANGNNLGMNPYEYLLAGLGACTSMTLKMYAAHKNIPLDGVKVTLKHEKVHAEHCEQCESGKGKIDTISKTISLYGPLSDDQKKRLYQIAEKCPVNRTLKSDISIKAIHDEEQH